MKAYSKEEIDTSFQMLIKAIEANEISEDELRIKAGALSVSINFRKVQLKSGYSQSKSRALEISKLEAVESNLNFFINSSTYNEIASSLISAYTVYAKH